MTLTTPIPTDVAATDVSPDAADGGPSQEGNLRVRRFTGPSTIGLTRRAFAWQLVSGVTAVGVLLIGAIAVADAPRHSGLIWLPVVAALGISIGLVFLGAMLAGRTLRPVADVEGQLHRLALSGELPPQAMEKLEGYTPLEAGWNRLVDSILAADHRQTLNDRLEAAMLEYRHRRGEQILNVLTDGIAVTDDNQLITFANNALSAILHSDGEDEDLLKRSLEEALAQRAGQELSADLVDPRYRGRQVVGEITCPGDESACVLRVCRSPLGPPGGSAHRGFVWSIRDITQQTMADKMRDQFVNAATHELRTPMANIKAYAETLALGEVDDVEQQKAFCNVINEEVSRLARFVDDLLHLSRMEVGATTLQLQVTEMRRFFEEIVEKVRPQMDRKDIRFNVEMPAKLPELTVDKDKLAVAMINLLGNGVKYTPDGGSVRLRIGMDDDSMQIDVEDTGIGIAEEELPRVLEKFYRSSDPRVHGETGSGLGLSLTNEIIRLHGGKLTITSELDKGSTFAFTLPVNGR